MASKTDITPGEDYAIEVDDVTMIFNMASESLTNLKEYFIKLAKHELFFEEFRALKHISFDVHRGEVVGLVGTNGSGKSTMLKIIAGVLEPSEGEVIVHGNIAPLIELGAGQRQLQMQRALRRCGEERQAQLGLLGAQRVARHLMIEHAAGERERNDDQNKVGQVLLEEKAAFFHRLHNIHCEIYQRSDRMSVCRATSSRLQAL